MNQGSGRTSPPCAVLALWEVHFDFGEPERRLTPVAFVEGDLADELCRTRPEAVVVSLDAQGRPGLLVDATTVPGAVAELLHLVGTRRALHGAHGSVVGAAGAGYRSFVAELGAPAEALQLVHATNAVVVDGQVRLAFLDSIGEGTAPGAEIERFLTERARFAAVPRFGAPSAGGPRASAASR